MATTTTKSMNGLPETRPNGQLSEYDIYQHLPGQPAPVQRGQGPFDTYPYNHLLPTVFPKPGERDPPLEDLEFSDPGLRALKHPNPRSFLDKATKISHITPVIGTEVDGVDLVSLTSDERDQLALEVARRKLLVFRNQESFFNAGGEFWKEWGSHFGRLHVHPTGGHPEGLPEIHMIYRDENTVYYDTDRIITTNWHNDVSWERQPPGLTAFFLLAYPATGGDTAFCSGEAVLDKFSPDFVAYLRTLRQVQVGIDPIKVSRGGKRERPVRRDCVTTIHPIIRRHPVTGKEALWVNAEMTLSIVGYKKEESDTILNFLYNHIAIATDCHARVRWEPYTVVLWDNRNTMHKALFDYAGSKDRRHGARITPQAERPIPALQGLSLDD